MTEKIYPVPRGRPDRKTRLMLVNRRREVANLYMSGLDQYQIGDRLGISQPIVSMDIAAVKKRWLQSSLRDWDTLKAEELAKIERTEEEAWAAWERSQRDAETIHVRTESAPRMNGENILVEETRKTIKEKTVQGQVGDPRFLEVIAKCREQRCKIFGLFRDVNINNTIIGAEAFYRLYQQEAAEGVPDEIEARLVREEQKLLEVEVVEGRVNGESR